jgi:recombination protein RecT
MAKNNGELLSKINGNASKAVAVPSDNIASYLQRDDVKQQIALALPKHLTSDRLARVALTTIRLNPTLAECNTASLMAAIMQSAQLGLEPGLLGHAYFVPFNRKIKQAGQPDRWVKDVQFIIGYRGLIDLARRSGAIVTIAADVIGSKDKFTYRKGFDEVLEHEPSYIDRGEIIAAYAYATTKDGGRYAVVMNKQEIEKIRRRSKAADAGPWVSDWEEMAKKTVLRRLSKYLPMSIEFAQVDAEDSKKEAIGFGGDVQAIEVNHEPTYLVDHGDTEPEVETLEFEDVEERAATQAEGQ